LVVSADFCIFVQATKCAKIMQHLSEIQARDRLLELYDAAPYPDSQSGKTQQNNPLLTHWINAVHGFQKPILAADSRILVAGCGSGAEAFVLAKLYPKANIVGIDFSARSIEKAKKTAAEQGFDNLIFEVADLMDDWASRYDLFDFILCYGVADYVLDPALLLQNFAKSLSPKGIIYIACNSPHHPAHRIRQAFAALNIPPNTFTDSPQQRDLLQLVAQLMGNDAKIFGLGEAQKSYLDVDIFPPIAHHLSIDDWLKNAQKAGLHFSASMDAIWGLSDIADAQLPMLYNLNKADLSLWLLKLYQRPAMQLLFSREPKAAPNFTDLAALWQWKPRIDACLSALPDLQDDPNKPLNITLRFEGIADFVIYSNAYDLAVLRRCDGLHTLAEILADIPAQGDLDSLLACLFRAYHYGLLSD
jgi:SAM-dependent methyltransferase